MCSEESFDPNAYSTSSLDEQYYEVSPAGVDVSFSGEPISLKLINPKLVQHSRQRSTSFAPLSPGCSEPGLRTGAFTPVDKLMKKAGLKHEYFKPSSSINEGQGRLEKSSSDSDSESGNYSSESELPDAKNVVDVTDESDWKSVSSKAASSSDDGIIGEFEGLKIEILPVNQFSRHEVTVESVDSDDSDYEAPKAIVKSDSAVSINLGSAEVRGKKQPAKAGKKEKKERKPFSINLSMVVRDKVYDEEGYEVTEEAEGDTIAYRRPFLAAGSPEFFEKYRNLRRLTELNGREALRERFHLHIELINALRDSRSFKRPELKLKVFPRSLLLWSISFTIRRHLKRFLSFEELQNDFKLLKSLLECKLSFSDGAEVAEHLLRADRVAVGMNVLHDVFLRHRNNSLVECLHALALRGCLLGLKMIFGRYPQLLQQIPATERTILLSNLLSNGQLSDLECFRFISLLLEGESASPKDLVLLALDAKSEGRMELVKTLIGKYGIDLKELE